MDYRIHIPLQQDSNGGESIMCAVAPTLNDLESKKKWINENLGVSLNMDSKVKCEQMADLIMKYSSVFGNENNMDFRVLQIFSRAPCTNV